MVTPARLGALKASPALGIFGYGAVGRILARQAKDIGMQVGLVADSSGIIVSASKDEGFSQQILKDLEEAKASGTPLKNYENDQVQVFSNPTEALDQFKGAGDMQVIADCSAFGSPEPYLLPALERGMPIALANKKPVTGPVDSYKQLMKDPTMVGIESTCGAGLPVIVTIDRLLDAGDEITRVEGQLSGTLGYILSGLEQGGKFSDIVREAKENGFTEPDPRDDLGGSDVARKALIISRKGFGDMKGEMEDISVEPLYPPEFESLSLDEFMDRLPELDSMFDEKVKAANSKNRKLRYTALVQPGEQIKVGLQEVDADSPLYSLKGTDNLVSFTSKWYNTNPTVVRGPGAGGEVTAAGVLADVVQLSLQKQ